MHECKNSNRERKQLDSQENVKFSLCCHLIWFCDSNLISTAGIPGELGKSVSSSGMLHPQPNHKCGFTAKHNLSIFSFCAVGIIKCRQHQMFTSYGILFSPIKYHKIIFSWPVDTFQKADPWIHVKKDRKVYREKIFFCARIPLLEISIKGITSKKLNKLLI